MATMGDSSHLLELLSPKTLPLLLTHIRNTNALAGLPPPELLKWCTKLSSLLSTSSTNVIDKWCAASCIFETIRQVALDELDLVKPKCIHGWCQNLWSATNGREAHTLDILSVMVQLLIACKSFPELRREVVAVWCGKVVQRACETGMQILSAFSTHGEAEANDVIFIMSLLESLIGTSPSTVKPHFEKVNTFCTETIIRAADSTELVAAATKCMIAICDSSKEKEKEDGTAKVVEKMYCTAEDVLDGIFGVTVSDRPAGYSLSPSTENDEILRLEHHTKQFCGIAQGLFQIVRSTHRGFNVAVLMDLIRRVWSVTYRMHFDQSNTSSKLVTPFICVSANALLSSLLSRNLLADHTFVWAVCLKGLEMSKGDTMLRVSAYNMVAQGVEAFGCCFGGEAGLENLIDTITSDMSVTASASAASTATNEIKRKLEPTKSGVRRSIVESTGLASVKIAALEALSTVLVALPASVPAGRLGNVALALLQVLFHGSPGSYTCQILSCLIKIAGRGEAVPVILTVLTRYLWSADPEVRSISKSGLEIVEIVVRGRRPRWEYQYTPEEIEPSLMPGLEQASLAGQPSKVPPTFSAEERQTITSAIAQPPAINSSPMEVDQMNPETAPKQVVPSKRKSPSFSVHSEAEKRQVLGASVSASAEVAAKPVEWSFTAPEPATPVEPVSTVAHDAAQDRTRPSSDEAGIQAHKTSHADVPAGEDTSDDDEDDLPDILLSDDDDSS
ncbi:hypothetical protein HDU85_005264 [Gaertneriomyces sp. JEL0708]|nr:hypothetical protein HDU85_005264 [Gaertneriomyces sp. JEL0708]